MCYRNKSQKRISLTPAGSATRVPIGGNELLKAAAYFNRWNKIENPNSNIWFDRW
jgi:hypothetical protein